MSDYELSDDEAADLHNAMNEPDALDDWYRDNRSRARSPMEGAQA